jgi:hypothetical protein
MKKRSLEEIEFLRNAMGHLKSMSVKEYKAASEKLEIIGRKARELR